MCKREKTSGSTFLISILCDSKYVQNDAMSFNFVDKQVGIVNVLNRNVEFNCNFQGFVFVD